MGHVLLMCAEIGRRERLGKGTLPDGAVWDVRD
jgi:hypothetical protein